MDDEPPSVALARDTVSYLVLLRMGFSVPPTLLPTR